MIEKKRLEELIEQNKPIFLLEDKGIRQLKQIKYWKVGIDRIVWYADKGIYKLFENLFETQEEAEWHQEFGCIERTERLELPTWEEIPFEKQNYYVKKFVIKDNCDYFGRLVVDNNVIRVMGLVQGCLFEEYFNEIRSKKNYIKACEICKKLFLGQLNNS